MSNDWDINDYPIFNKRSDGRITVTHLPPRLRIAKEMLSFKYHCEDYLKILTFEISCVNLKAVYQIVGELENEYLCERVVKK